MHNYFEKDINRGPIAFQLCKRSTNFNVIEGFIWGEHNE